MKVSLIAHTELGMIPSIHGTAFGDRLRDSGDADILAEFAGRACYQSWDLPNPKTATNEGYLANIIGQGHFSVLEHASATFYVEGVSRSLTHELVRHRHLSYSELSQRYVNVGESKFIDPPLMRSEAGFCIEGSIVADEMRANYDELVRQLTDAFPDATRKQVREAARAVMPNCTETKIVVTGNMRAWRDFLHKRWHVAADAEIRELAGLILADLRDIAPNSFQDIPVEPFQ